MIRKIHISKNFEVSINHHIGKMDFVIEIRNLKLGAQEVQMKKTEMLVIQKEI
jgi:hypothetical protein